ncbi:hypothetical protein CR513_60462, partial [Mucuna pruriens]
MKRMFLEKFFLNFIATSIRKEICGNTQQFSVRGPTTSKVLNGVIVVDNQTLENKITELTSLIRQQAIGQNHTSPLAKVCGICASIEHPTDVCPTLQETKHYSVEITTMMDGQEYRQPYDQYSNLRYGSHPMQNPVLGISIQEEGECLHHDVVFRDSVCPHGGTHNMELLKILVRIVTYKTMKLWQQMLSIDYLIEDNSKLKRDHNDETDLELERQICLKNALSRHSVEKKKSTTSINESAGNRAKDQYRPSKEPHNSHHNDRSEGLRRETRQEKEPCKKKRNEARRRASQKGAMISHFYPLCKDLRWGIIEHEKISRGRALQRYEEEPHVERRRYLEEEPYGERRERRYGEEYHGERRGRRQDESPCRDHKVMIIGKLQWTVRMMVYEFCSYALEWWDQYSRKVREGKTRNIDTWPNL